MINISKRVITLMIGATIGSASSWIVMRFKHKEGIYQISPNNVKYEDTEKPRKSKDWEDLLVSFSGHWISSDGDCEAFIDFREITFSSKNSWKDLDGKTFLLGETTDFITEKYYYGVNMVRNDLDFISIMRRDKKIETKNNSCVNSPVVELKRVKLND